MSSRRPFARAARAAALVATLVLSGCATVSLEENLARTNDEAAGFTAGNLVLAPTEQDLEARRKAADELLAAPLGPGEAVKLALLNSPALQALLAQHWAEATAAAQSGRIANPVFVFERIRTVDELELGRLLAFGLLDLLTLPQRKLVADQRVEQSRVRLTADVVDQVTAVRQAWVRAVGAQQTLQYAQQVYRSAEASAELARRMQAAGNFNRLDRARQQAFYADAAAQLASSRHQATASREELGRLLGLDDAQAKALRLPPRLPDLPEQPLAPQDIGHRATRERLDIRLAQAQLDAAAKAQRLTLVTSFTDIELGVRRDTAFDNAEGTRSTPRGYEIAVRLPVFDWGDLQRETAGARTLAAARQLEATVRAAGSHLRESYSAYRTALDLARHYRDEVVPLRKVISEENLLRYNGMIIGVFELLADSRDQVRTVMAAIAAEEQFWLAEAALQASVIGKPVHSVVARAASASPAADGAGH